MFTVQIERYSYIIFTGLIERRGGQEFPFSAGAACPLLMKSNKVILFFVAAITFFCFFLIYQSFSNTKFLELEAEQNQDAIPSQEFEKVSSIILKYSQENMQGGIKFEVYDLEREKLLDTFIYNPWEGKIPLYQTLYNGNIILGNKWIFKLEENKLENLFPVFGQTLLDYSVKGDRIACIGYKKETREIFVYLYNIKEKHLLLVDSFTMPVFSPSPSVYVDQGSDGLVYYDYCEGSKPLVKAYDASRDMSTVFREYAMLPQVSPDGKHIVLHLTDSYFEEEQLFRRISLLRIDNKEQMTWLPNSRRIFWLEGFMVNYDDDMQKLQLYYLGEGKLVEELDVQGFPFEVKIKDDIVQIKAYHGERDGFVLTNYEVKL